MKIYGSKLNWHFVISGIKYVNSKSIYSKTNDFVEKSSENIFICMNILKICFLWPKLIESLFIYFTTNLGNVAFELPAPMWYEWILLPLFLISFLNQSSVENEFTQYFILKFQGFRLIRNSPSDTWSHSVYNIRWHFIVFNISLARHLLVLELFYFHLRPLKILKEPFAQLQNVPIQKRTQYRHSSKFLFLFSSIRQ